MNVLPLGSIVLLNKDYDKKETKLMIVVRNPVLIRENITGYTDYAAFNHEHIKEILFTGYIDELEEKYQKMYSENQGKYKYPRLTF